MIVFCLGGFIIPKANIKVWWKWNSWVSISVNEFNAERWMKLSSISNITVGRNVLHQFNLPHDDYWWLGFGVLLTCAILFNIIVTMALAYLNPRRRAQTVADDAIEEESLAIKVMRLKNLVKRGW
ncbi:hypothetical protein K2173_023949 [Erythroxylum novogranatense]|uniref:Plant PDR ABC transporter associated domain-containing protein n=1 Tax=Erythroxylum novogranatense TaxID=1862640 RepID=A0AAV8TS98_9ROSI|nr:hypothetical protein K2173_023949 [Erythroxylum novogranatense]